MLQLLFPVTLSRWACSALHKHLQKPWTRPHTWEAALAPWSGCKLGQADPSCCSGQACQGLKADHSPVAHESALNIEQAACEVSPSDQIVSLGSRSISHPKFQKVKASERNDDFPCICVFPKEKYFLRKSVILEFRCSRPALKLNGAFDCNPKTVGMVKFLIY